MRIRQQRKEIIECKDVNIEIQKLRPEKEQIKCLSDGQMTERLGEEDR
jgi:hypothetical protein